MTRPLSRPAMLLVVAVAMLTPELSAAQWDARTDFSIASNPNGAWTYGLRNTLLSTSLTPYTLTGINGTQAYQSTTTYAAPGVFQNISGSSQVYYGTVLMQAGQLASHPGPSGEFSIIRFTAPSAGSYSLATSFIGVDFGGIGTSSDVNVVVDGTAIFSAFINGYGASQSFSGTLALGVGSVVDIAVGFGSNGNWYDDSTGIEATISQATTAPEPASLVLTATGLLGIAGVVSRRRRVAA